jgi:putative phage-type endonuclease
MNIIDVPQRSPAWRHWRAQGLSASEAAVIMSRSPYKTPWRLWAEKKGLVPEENLVNNPLVRIGVEQEPLALQRFEEKHDVLLLPVCAESSRYPLMRASFDGLTEQDEPVEVKCPHETTFLDVLLNREQSAAYQLYWCQVQQQMLVSEAERGFLCFYYQGQDVEFVIQRDEIFLNQLVATAMDFWSAVKSGTEPAKDPERDVYLPSGEAEPQWQQLSGQFRQTAVKIDNLKAQLKALEVQQTPIEESLVALMGDFLVAEHAGLRVSRFQVQGSIDYKLALSQLLPAITEASLEGYRKPSSQRVRITCREGDGQSSHNSECDPKCTEQSCGDKLSTGQVSTDFWF